MSLTTQFSSISAKDFFGIGNLFGSLKGDLKDVFEDIDDLDDRIDTIYDDIDNTRNGNSKDNLTITQRGSSTLIRDGDDLLATVIGTRASLITTADFITT